MKRGLLALVALLSACSAGPDFHRPEPPPVHAYSTQASPGQNLVLGAAIPARWWEVFHSPELNQLVRQALAANPNIAAARAALIVAQENVAAQRSGFWPQASAGFTPTRQEIGGNLSSPLYSPANPFSLHTAQVSVSYTPDVFGGARRQVESAEAQAEFQGYELEAARQSLAANVVVAAVQEASLRGQIAATEALIALQEKTLEIARRQLALGAISDAGVAAQEAVLAQDHALLPSLRKQLAQNRDLLTALAGAFPDQELAATFDLAHLAFPQELPLSLPSTLVERRPDVRAAEALAHATCAQIGVADANRLPQFSIDANLGSVATHLADLFKSGGGLWSLAGNVTQPLFDAGALGHRKSAAVAALDQVQAQYRATVVAAFQNVADCLHALQQDEETLRATSAASQASRRSLELARRQHELGDLSTLALLGYEQNEQLATLALVQAHASRLADTAALYQALGG